MQIHSSGVPSTGASGYTVKLRLPATILHAVTRLGNRMDFRFVSRE